MTVNKSYVYILKCADNTLYTGWTNNLVNRFNQHQSGHGSKYTRVRLPVHLVYTEEYAEKNLAMKREAEIKAMSRREKLDLISMSPTQTQQLLGNIDF